MTFGNFELPLDIDITAGNIGGIRFNRERGILDRLIRIKLLEDWKILDFQFPLFPRPFQNTIVFNAEESFQVILLFQIRWAADRNGFLIKFIAIISTNDQFGAGLVGLSTFEIFWESYLMSALLGFE
ncbi:MAG: hypothetical protein ACFFD2_13085 [Promethearchaeota archaeon]